MVPGFTLHTHLSIDPLSVADLITKQVALQVRGTGLHLLSCSAVRQAKRQPSKRARRQSDSAYTESFGENDPFTVEILLRGGAATRGLYSEG